MTHNSELSKTSAKAIRLIYFLIISLAITGGLKYCIQSFYQSSSGRCDFKLLSLFVVFMTFVVRFFLGSYKCLTYDIEVQHNRKIILVDSLGFFSNSILLYIWSLSYQDPTKSIYLILILCIIDTIWLVLVRLASKGWERFQIQWIWHNIVFILICVLLLKILWKEQFVLLVVSCIAFILDFTMNFELYFPKRYPKVLKVFIAGPYGDNLTEEEIKKNVLNAEIYGKNIALKGHIPFIPHKMLEGWQKDNRFSVKDFKKIDETWLNECDALYYTSQSKGADEELKTAKKMGLFIIYNIDDLDNLE